MVNFNAQLHKDNIVKWIKKYFAENGPESQAIIGISGGKDSTIVAALCVEALGKERVLGIRMPNHAQDDIADADEVCRLLDIKAEDYNIGALVDTAYRGLRVNPPNLFDSGMSPVVMTNLPARMRMLILYAFANQCGGRVACTDNLSEAAIGYNTRWGDDVGDFAPIRQLTASEVIEIGKLCSNIPERLITKAPRDGLQERTDEEVFGFTYRELDDYLRGSRDLNEIAMKKIESRMKQTEYKNSDICAYLPMSF